MNGRSAYKPQNDNRDVQSTAPDPWSLEALRWEGPGQLGFAKIPPPTDPCHADPSRAAGVVVRLPGARSEVAGRP